VVNDPGPDWMKDVRPGYTSSMSSEVRRNEGEQRYEIYRDGRLAGVADFYEHDGAVVFPHTFIDADLRGRGLAAELVRYALDDARATGKRVVARCWYVAQFIDDHGEYAELLAERPSAVD
jgi:predicted GNAT family acetyltransferase